MGEHPINSLMSDTLEKIKQLVDTETIIGKPIVAGETTIIPISRVSFGFGSGGSDFTSKHAKESAPLCFGGGGGAGLTVNPVAFVVVDAGGTRILPINAQASSTVDRLVEMLPDAVSKVSSFVAGRKEAKKDNGQTAQDEEIPSYDA